MQEVRLDGNSPLASPGDRHLWLVHSVVSEQMFFLAFAHSFLHQDACAELCDQAHALRDVELFQAPSSSHSDTTQLIFSFLLLLHPSSFALFIMSSWDGT